MQAPAAERVQLMSRNLIAFLFSSLLCADAPLETLVSTPACPIWQMADGYWVPTDAVDEEPCICANARAWLNGHTPRCVEGALHGD